MYTMLRSRINCSIAKKEEHFSEEALLRLLTSPKNEHPTMLEQYAYEALKTEVSEKEAESYCKIHKLTIEEKNEFYKIKSA